VLKPELIGCDIASKQHRTADSVAMHRVDRVGTIPFVEEVLIGTVSTL